MTPVKPYKHIEISTFLENVLNQLENVTIFDKDMNKDRSHTEINNEKDKNTTPNTL